MNILVTGGNGYLGSHIANYLMENGHEVTIVGTRRHSDLENWYDNFKLLLADISDDQQTSNLCKNIDIVIHCAATNAAESEKKALKALLVNGYGTRNVLESANNHQVKLFIYLSTFHVYGLTTEQVITEETIARPVTDYSITHLLGENYCREYSFKNGLPSIVLRISNGYGRPLFKSIDCWSLVINDFCKRAVEDGRIVIRSSGKQKRDFVAISDILQAINIFIEEASKSSGHNLYNIGNDNNMSIFDVAQLTAKVYKELFNKSITIHVGNTSEPSRDFTYDISKLKELGYTPKANLETEIKLLLEYIK